MKKQAFAIAIFIVIAAIAAATLIFNAVNAAKLSDIQVQRPNIIVHGVNLGKVEIWGISIQGLFQKLAIAQVKDTDATGLQTWIAPIPAETQLIDQIFALGYDKNGKLFGQIALAGIGGAALHDILLGRNTTSSQPQGGGGSVTASTDITLTAGDTETFQNMSLTFNSFVQDSRCPIDVQCFWAGNVTVNVTIKSSGELVTRDLTTDVAPFRFGGYAISILDVQPPKESKLQIPTKAYQITFHIESV